MESLFILLVAGKIWEFQRIDEKIFKNPSTLPFPALSVQKSTQF